jgi:heterodisulfide reductase subunit C
MGVLYDKLMQDVRFIEGLKACIHCGTCTAICPAAEFWNYDPRQLIDILQSKDEQQIEELLKSDMIWYCGECMSCKTRCPRDNAPGLVIMALRNLSQEMGFFTESEKGRQQLAVKRIIGDWILKHGYCLIPNEISFENHPEQGPMWEWELANMPDVMARLGANFQGSGPGAMRTIPEESMDEIRKIFEVTGGLNRYAHIEDCSRRKAAERGEKLDDGMDNPYFKTIYG